MTSMESKSEILGESLYGASQIKKTALQGFSVQNIYILMVPVMDIESSLTFSRVTFYYLVVITRFIFFHCFQ